MKILVLSLALLAGSGAFAKTCIKKKKDQACKAPYVAVDNGGIVDCCKDFDNVPTGRCTNPHAENCGVQPQADEE